MSGAAANAERCRAWLFDIYPECASDAAPNAPAAPAGRIVSWWITEDDRRLRLTEPFAPVFYIEPPPAPATPTARRLGFDRETFARALADAPGIQPAGLTEQLDIWSDRPTPVLAVRVTDFDRAHEQIRELALRFPGLAFYNCDIPPEVHYGYRRGFFATARCRIAHADGRLLDAALEDDPLDPQFELPPLRIVELAAQGELVGPRPRLHTLSLSCDGRTICWQDCEPAEMLRSLRDALRREDPDLIWTEGGDSVLMAALFTLAQRHEVDIALDRDPGLRRRIQLDGRSYMSYGVVLYAAPDYPLRGRWHLDRANSFWAGETGLEGLIEVVRLARIPVQRAARRSIGTGISSMQLDLAYRDGYLIPWKKSRPEDWKSAALLLRADRGGLTYQPLTGVYEHVVELDFASMYPSIMSRFNVSPETVNCACCRDDEPRPNSIAPEPRVPEIGYTICRRRRGIVPRTLEAVIEKRATYKRLLAEARALTDPEDAAARRARFHPRQSAIKWLMVCCFGYLRYHNARFGRAEAHEATCAFSREKLIRAREICEDAGFEVLHAIVDCVWLRRPDDPDRPIPPAEIDALIAAINRATGLIIALEGRYDWLAFLPSSQDPELPVPNRYFGRFEDGELKFRGIEARRSDQTPCTRELQARLLDVLSEADSLAACRALQPRLLDVVREAEAQLFDHRTPLEQLVYARRTSRAAEDYKGNSMTALAARQARRAGIRLSAGQKVRYVVIAAGDRDPEARVRVPELLRTGETYDAAHYAAQLRKAATTLFEPLLGKTAEQLLGPMRGTKPRAAKRRAADPPRPAKPAISQPDFLAGPG